MTYDVNKVDTLINLLKEMYSTMKYMKLCAAVKHTFEYDYTCVYQCINTPVV